MVRGKFIGEASWQKESRAARSGALLRALIDAFNGSAALEITANGSVTGGSTGISARNAGTSLTVTTGTTVEGTTNHDATNDGDGALEITANGSVIGPSAASMPKTTAAAR